jgi:aryl-alcohol dehydrogenase-like predicted oxidoreductase
MRQLHSLKGLAGMFALKPVQASAHELESAILAFAHQPAITAAIVGIRTPEQVAGVRGALEFRLSESEFAEIEGFRHAG